MSVTNQSAIRNRLLSRLSADDFRLLAAHLEPLPLPRRFVLTEPEQAIEQVYFPDAGIVSIVAVSAEGHQAEAGIFGREGFGPTVVVMGSDRTPNRQFMQVPGEGHRIDRRIIEAAAERSATLRTLLMRFVLTLNLQTTYTALCNATHHIEERLARWLLMCHDRTEGDEIALTHDFMAVMLAVRRPSVTTALHTLEGNGFVHAERGRITIRDRAALARFARDAYGKPEAEYRRLIGELR